MFWREGCPACKATKPLMEWKVIPHYPQVVFRFLNTWKGDPILESEDDEEEFNADLLEDKCAVDVMENEDLDYNEKMQDMWEGQYESSALPTFIIYDDEHPQKYETYQGAVGEDHTHKDDKKFIKGIREMLNKFLMRAERKQYEGWKYGAIQAS
jgi:thiol-disulfide isomerase/thioredoxin